MVLCIVRRSVRDLRGGFWSNSAEKREGYGTLQLARLRHELARGMQGLPPSRCRRWRLFSICPAHILDPQPFLPGSPLTPSQGRTRQCIRGNTAARFRARTPHSLSVCANSPALSLRLLCRTGAGPPSSALQKPLAEVDGTHQPHQSTVAQYSGKEIPRSVVIRVMKRRSNTREIWLGLMRISFVAERDLFLVSYLVNFQGQIDVESLKSHTFPLAYYITVLLMHCSRPFCDHQSSPDFKGATG